MFLGEIQDTIRYCSGHYKISKAHNSLQCGADAIGFIMQLILIMEEDKGDKEDYFFEDVETLLEDFWRVEEKNGVKRS